MAEFRKEFFFLKPEKKESLWMYLPKDDRSWSLAIVQFLDSTGGRDKVFIIRYLYF